MNRSWLTRNLYMRLNQALQGETTFGRIRQLQAHETVTPETRRQHQWASLQETLDHARQIPYYRTYLSQPVESWEAFRQLPLLDKQQVRDHFDSLYNPALRKGTALGQTSGSTGAPMRFLHSREFGSRHEAGQWRARSWFGILPGDAVFAVWGRPISKSENRLLQLKSFLNHILHVSAFDLERDYCIQLARRLQTFRPRLVYGYPSGIYEVARVAEQEGIPLHHLGVRQVACTAEILYPFQIELLGRVFAAPVSNVYGCSEFGAFAHQCPRGHMHISDENILIEFLGEDGLPVRPGETGEVVVTSLHNPVMPLIRYRVGDMGIPLSHLCPCGRTMPLMDVKAGKLGQMIRTRQGKKFNSELFDYINKRLMTENIRGIAQFLVIQESLDDFLVQLVEEPGDLPRARHEFEKGMRSVLGSQPKIRFECVAQIRRHDGGKLGYFESRLQPEEAVS